MQITDLRNKLSNAADNQRADFMQRYFKTGKGEYGEGDIFIGVSVPEQRKIAKQFLDIPFKELHELLHSKIHEERLTALLNLVYRFEKANENGRKEIFNFLIKNRKQINNWDLVDLTAPKSIGEYLVDKEKSILYELVNSENIWDRRIAVMSTFPLIKRNKFNLTLEFAKILLNDDHDLIQKAVGWMLREIGKRDMTIVETFLNKYYKKMPRTMLRYAIEKFPEVKRKKYLAGKI
jgi:3-methyladenine DNA glycosylase AlkD